MRSAVPLRAYYLASFAAGGVYLPYFPQWLAGRGIHGLELGIVSAAAPAMGLVAPTAFGVVADALALRGGLLQLASAGAALAFGGLAALLALGARLGFREILLLALAIALFRSPMTTIMDVVAIEKAPRLGTTYGRLRLWGSLGFLLGAVGGGVVVDPRGALAFPVVCTTLLATAFAASLWLPSRADLSHRGRPQGVIVILQERDFWIFLVASFFGQCAQAAYDLGFSMRLAELGVAPGWVGVVWAIGVASEVLLLAHSGRLLRSIRAPALLALALLGAAARWAALATVHSIGWLALLQPLHAVAFGMVWIAQVTYTSRRFPSHSLATAQGLFATSIGLGSVVGMVVWGPVQERLGGAFMFAGAACFAVCASGFAFALDRQIGVQRSPAHAGSGGGRGRQVRDGSRFDPQFLPKGNDRDD